MADGLDIHLLVSQLLVCCVEQIDGGLCLLGGFMAPRGLLETAGDRLPVLRRPPPVAGRSRERLSILVDRLFLIENGLDLSGNHL